MIVTSVLQCDAMCWGICRIVTNACVWIFVDWEHVCVRVRVFACWLVLRLYEKVIWVCVCVACVYACVYQCVCVCVCEFERECVPISVPAYVDLCLCPCTCLCLCLCLCMCASGGVSGCGYHKVKENSRDIQMNIPSSLSKKKCFTSRLLVQTWSPLIRSHVTYERVIGHVSYGAALIKVIVIWVGYVMSHKNMSRPIWLRHIVSHECILN